MMESLGRYRQDEGTMNVSGGADSLLQRWGLEAGFSKLLSTETWNFRPSLPTPSLNLSSYLPSTAPGGPNWTAPKANLSGGASAGFFRGLLWVALAGVLGVLVWRLLGAKKRGSGVQGLAEANRMRSLGPWPVAPQEVKTRSEFIQAFEYLSLLLLGRDARNWNHRQIGATLAGANRAREEQQAARVLTALYETARYAPATQAVTADDLAQARRHLCLLAGVAAA
jgi:hypothetical protein